MTAADPVDAVPPKALLDTVTAYFQPQKAILFGSHARSEAGLNSDCDLFMIDDDTPAAMDWRDRHEARTSFRRAADAFWVGRHAPNTASKLSASSTASVQRSS